MLDRASTFADRKIIELLRTRFIPAAIDQFYYLRQKDPEGEFWRKIAKQKGWKSDTGTTQGLYIVSASGKLIEAYNNRGSDKLHEQLLKTLEEFKPPKDVELISEERDPEYSREIPEGTMVVRTHAKVLNGYEESKEWWHKIMRKAVSRDNLWIAKSEQAALKKGTVPATLQRRIALFHLIDNTRGEPQFWKDKEVESSTWSLDKTGKLTGKVVLKRGDGTSSYNASVLGFVEFDGPELARFDLVSLGPYHGSGRYTGHAPKGEFDLAVSFRLVAPDERYAGIAPQGTKGWQRVYWASPDDESVSPPLEVSDVRLPECP